MFSTKRRKLLNKDFPLIELDSFDYDNETGQLLIRFNNHSNSQELFSTNVIKLVYTTVKPSSITVCEATDILCSIVLPHAAVKLGRVQINAPCSETQQSFWPWYIQSLLQYQKNRPVVRLNKTATRESSDVDGSAEASKDSTCGLLFGGGVESLAALSFLLDQKPVLLSLTGPRWMNNDYALSPLKRRLEDQLLSEFELTIARVWHNTKQIVSEGDEYINMYITGSLMYYSTAPVLRQMKIRAVFHAMELEYTQVGKCYDRSINPAFSYVIPRKNLPPLVPILSSIAKVEILEMLYHRNPRLCSYLYSCLNNSDRRWCGKCGKCARISAFCEAIGIPKAHIGMQEAIPHVPEKGEITRLFWKNLKLYRSKRRNNRKSIPEF